MRNLQKPLSIAELTKKLASQGDATRLFDLMARRQIVDDKGRYLHWDDFRRKVTDNGLSVEEDWFATRTARVAAAQPVPLLDVHQRRFTFCEPPELRATLQYMDMYAGGTLATSEQTLTQADGSRYFTRSLAEEPFASSFIEGAATTRRIAKQLIYERREPKTKDELMVLNNYRGMEFIKTIVGQPLTVEAILETHRIMTEGTLDNPLDAGRLREADDVAVFDESTNEILHQPPPYGTLPDRLQALCDFANSRGDASGASFIHPLIRAFILHFMLAYDHPFVDGNGRTARALFYWSALSSKYWLIEYASISSVIAEAKPAYGLAFLYTETDESDLTYFLLHQARTLRKAMDSLLAYAERKRVEYTEFQRRVLDSEAEYNKRQTMLLSDAIKSRVASITIAEHMKVHKVTRLTARADLESLVEKGLFRKKKRGKENHYIPVSDLLAKVTRLG